ncbi:TPA: hypothetical protein ACPJ1C_000813 [Vibrio diabolicus]
MEFLESRINKLLGEARKIEIDVAHHQISWSQWDPKQTGGTPPEYLLDGDEECEKPFKHLTASLYLSVSCYLDMKGYSNYLSLFRELFGSGPDNIKDRDKFDIDHYWFGEPYSVFLARLTQFLQVFEFMESDDSRYTRLSGIQYLENILNNTASIVSRLEKVPKSETEVYNAVKGVFEAIFPTAKYPKSNFIKTVKEYKPDILIPELFTAIEYKYAKTEDKLKATIEQVAADVKGYTGDRDYSIFYAVFYVTTDFWGRERFMTAWNEQKFPKNWIPVYVVGQ